MESSGWPDPSRDKAVAEEQRGECHRLRQTQQRGENDDAEEEEEEEEEDSDLCIIIIRPDHSAGWPPNISSLYRCWTWRLPSSNASPRWRIFYQNEFVQSLKTHSLQVEKLIQEMKTANLESLTISPPEESKAFLDGDTSSSNHISSNSQNDIWHLHV